MDVQMPHCGNVKVTAQLVCCIKWNVKCLKWMILELISLRFIRIPTTLYIENHCDHLALVLLS